MYSEPDDNFQPNEPIKNHSLDHFLINPISPKKRGGKERGENQQRNKKEEKHFLNFLGEGGSGLLGG